MAMIYIYGNDEYKVKEREKFIVREFIKKYGDLNILSTNNPEDVFVLPMFGEKKMLIMRMEKKKENSEQDDNREQEILKIVKIIPDFCVLLFVYKNPDGRRKIHKDLKVIADKIYEENEIDSRNLESYIKQQAEEIGFKIDSNMISRLVNILPANAGIVSRELEKLKYYKENPSAEDLEILIARSVEAEIFKLTESFGKKNTIDCLKIIKNFKESEESEFMISSMLGWFLRNVSMAKTAQIFGLDKDSYIKEAKVTPFTAPLYWKIAQDSSIERLRKLTEEMINIEKNKKSGNETNMWIAIEEMFIENT